MKSRDGGAIRRVAARGHFERVRSGFTILEITLALGVLAVAMVIAAQVGFHSALDRAHTRERGEAAELAANVLEAARACPWHALTPEWAAEQHFPETLETALHGGKLEVCVEPEKGKPRIKRVTVTVQWQRQGKRPARPVELIGFFSDRSSTEKEKKP